MNSAAPPATVLPAADPTSAARSTPANASPGLSIERHFTRPGLHPCDAVMWETRDARITGEAGQTVFEQPGVEVPADWSQLATNVVASKYFRGPLDSPRRERSVRQLLARVVGAITAWGRADGYFHGQDADTFAAELTHILLHQKASFNSPVWFNIGVAGAPPQASACFILSVRDDMDAILAWYRQEGIIFKGGSGSGVNLSRLRASGEPLSGGGTASGPLSFMRAADASAGAIKSGGTTRRSAKMVVLDADHPDIEAFIRCKAEEEAKAHALIDAGYDASLDGDAYATVAFQNANNSVRAPDAFMRAAVSGEQWQTRWRVRGGQPAQTYQARDLLRQIAEATWACGDPGMQFDDTINAWHTCPAAGRQEATNPCAEYCWIGDSACNLASLNLLAFLDTDGAFDVAAFRHAVRVMILAQEILVGRASYPTPAIERNSHDYRTLGLGYANLGALLMALSLPYDSDAGRACAAHVTALMTAEAYLTSARIAAAKGPFAGYARNREDMLRIIRRHQDSLSDLPLPSDSAEPPLRTAARQAWDECYAVGEQHGYRNAQVTLLAPTGTIAFMMDCDTTGIEPDLALVKHKKLVGGGALRLVNGTVPRALLRLGYTPEQVAAFVAYVGEHGHVEGAPGLHADHLPIFDCAVPATPGGRQIHYLGHLRMVAAVQPFLSGAVSKTINVPNEATVADIEQAYLDAWRLGIKCVSIYRDGCKRVQPLETSGMGAQPGTPPAVRRRLPDERPAITHKFSIAGHEGYITVGMFEDGTPGEIFLLMAKEGSTISGVMDAFATSISLALQYGVPLRALVDKFSHMRFEPAGFTGNPDIPIAKSIMDYISRWLAAKFLGPEARAAVGVREQADMEQAAPTEARNGHHPGGRGTQADAPACADCGALMTRNGACYRCPNCGYVSGCS